MPIYGYRCSGCGAEFELLQRMTDGPVATCASCGGAARRLIFPPAIVFKGSGFYKTDSRSGGGAGTKPPAAKPAESTAKGSSDGAAGARPESTTATSPGSSTGGTPSSGGRSDA